MAKLQLNREIAAALAAGPIVTISVDESTDEKTYTISDDGGEFDDLEDTGAPDVQSNINDRRAHYRAIGRPVLLDVPMGRGWR